MVIPRKDFANCSSVIWNRRQPSSDRPSRPDWAKYWTEPPDPKTSSSPIRPRHDQYDAQCLRWDYGSRESANCWYYGLNHQSRRWILITESARSHYRIYYRIYPANWNRVNFGATYKISRKVSAGVSVFQAISLMLLFGTFIIALLTYIDNHQNKK